MKKGIFVQIKLLTEVWPRFQSLLKLLLSSFLIVWTFKLPLCSNTRTLCICVALHESASSYAWISWFVLTLIAMIQFFLSVLLCVFWGWKTGCMKSCNVCTYGVSPHCEWGSGSQVIIPTKWLVALQTTVFLDPIVSLLVMTKATPSCKYFRTQISRPKNATQIRFEYKKHEISRVGNLDIQYPWISRFPTYRLPSWWAILRWGILR